MIGIIRKVAVVTLCLAPLALLLCSVATSGREHAHSWLASGLAGAALIVATLNIWITFVQPARQNRRDPSVPLRRVSAIPMVGTVFAVMARLVSSEDLVAQCISVVALVLDTGGAPWVLFWLWRNKHLVNR